MSNTLEHAQKLMLTLEEQVEKVGLRVNIKKTQYMYELRPILYCYKAALEEVLLCDKLGVSGSRNKTVVQLLREDTRLDSVSEILGRGRHDGGDDDHHHRQHHHRIYHQAIPCC